MPVFRVLASRTELHLVEAYVTAAGTHEAEEKFYGALQDESLALAWSQDFDRLRPAFSVPLLDLLFVNFDCAATGRHDPWRRACDQPFAWVWNTFGAGRGLRRTVVLA